ncbi:SGNH/GDSL hydrolase family protein [Aestuariibaculum suncheonense]|uniref:G-D-S-L family lipolytic protein n=1 Tax=Aestuariibaculum suncheonense TaxID=1028745 RepID=A0A8J6UIA1_9FLAO|nr:G-D-S-L family lipolytic protein [Aestuariibaculum suncheonense]MBD0833971.1 G-D-S-L family lipolytic protein [Aestuariibaculum suncheonense]
MKLKYIALLLFASGFTACNDIEDVSREEAETTFPEFTTGDVDFSNYIAVGGSFTAGYTDGALFKAGQENSFPNMLASIFTLAEGGDFKQPLMNDNIGGFLLNGVVAASPRLYFDIASSSPKVLNATPSTEITSPVNGPFNNYGIPGLKSFHLGFSGYGMLNPYFGRMTSSPQTATVLGEAVAQNPTFFTLSEIGGNDVLSYALAGGDGTDQTGNPNPATYQGNDITDPNVFAASFNAAVTALTTNGAKGVVTNVPYVKDLPHFTTVPYNPIPLDAATAAYLNSASAYGAYNAGITQAFAYLVANNLMSQADANTEISKRTITFEASESNAVVIMDESLTDLTSLNAALISIRQATADDLIVLTASNFIGTEAVAGNPQTVNGVAIPLADKWVLTPEEQTSIKTATDAYNATIASVVNNNDNLALVDLNTTLSQLATTGVIFDDFILKANLATGGAISLDGVHLTARGYAYLANKFLEAIDIAFGSNFTESGNVLKAGDYPTNYSPALQ